MTGRSNSATTSRKMWMLSASSALRWSSFSAAVWSGVTATVDISVYDALAGLRTRLKQKARVAPGLDLFSVFSGLFWFLPKQPDRCHGDLNGPGTTTLAGATGSG